MVAPARGSPSRQALAARLPELVETLLTSDYDADGRVDEETLPPARQLNLGLLTSDLGSGELTVTSCDPLGGDDALMGVAGPGCVPTPGFLSTSAGASSGAGDALACGLSHPTAEGCFIEQPLEAALKALSPAQADPSTGYVPPVFLTGEGHGDGAHLGFYDPAWETLAVLTMSTRSECSLADPLYFRALADGPHVTTRCGLQPEGLQPVGRYVDGLLRPGITPRAVVYAGLVGAPPDAIEATRGPGPTAGLDALLADPRMRAREDPTDPTRLIGACEAPDGRAIAPTPRPVALARELHARGASVSVASVCDEDAFAAALARFATQIGETFAIDCVERNLPRALDGGYDCELVVALSSSECAAAGGRVEEDSCALAPGRPTDAERAAGLPPAGAAWFVDDYTAEAQRECSDGSRIVAPGLAVAELRCATPTPEELGVDRACGGDDDCPDNRYGVEVACEPVADRCAARCDVRHDCVLAGLPDWSCDDRPGDEASGLGFCVPPCGG